MLAKDPAGRPSAAKVAEELGAILLESSRPAVLLPPKRTARIWRTALAMSLLAIALATWFGIKKREAPEFADLRIEPLTSQGGWELAPALSPDGQSIAFTWSDKLNGVRDIYVKRFSENDPVRITNESQGLIGYLAWSPDGKQIAFKHSIREYGNPGTISSIAVTGGKKRKLFDLANSNLSSALDWSPDGTELAFSENIPGTERLAIYLLNLKTGKTRKVTSPPPDDWGDWNPKFSPDGSTLAFKRVSGFWADDIYLVDRNGNALRRLTTIGRGIWGHAWVPDGKSLLVSCQRTGSIFGIWRFPLASDTQPERISVGGIDAISPTSSKKRNRIAWVSQLWDLNIYRTAITGAGVPLKLIASTLRDQGGTYSPDGRIAFVSDRSGSREIWLANGDGSGQVRVTDLKGPPVDDLQWSPDGRELAFTSRIADQVGIFALSCFADKMNCGKPRRLTSQVSDGSPAWSRDGSLLYFASRREGDWNIWAQPLRGGPIRKVTKTGGYTSRESPDGKWLYFSIPRVAAIYRVPLPKLALQNISSAELVVGAPYIVQSPGWALTRHEVIFIDRAAQDRSAVIRAYNPDTKVMRSIVSLNEVFADRSDIGISVSPDEKWILYSQLDRSGSNVMLAESR
jgi:Tol biopolymer transport system component